MSVKKVYFFKIDVLNIEEKEVDYHVIKDEIVKIVSENSHDQNNYKCLDITINLGDLHSVIDIFEYQNSRLYCRLSKQKPGNNFIGRNYQNYEKKDIVDSNDHENNGIEQYTFAMINYQIGVACVAFSKGAPNEKALEQMFDKYSDEYKIQLIPIPNEHGIDRIYGSENSDILNLEIDVPLPNGEALEDLFGWNPTNIINTIGERNLKASVCLKSNMNRGSITRIDEEVKGIIDAVKEKCRENRYIKAKMRARTKTVKARDYNFFYENFSYPIDINTYHIEDYKKVYYTVDELVEIFKKHMKLAYRESIEMSSRIINRNE